MAAEVPPVAQLDSELARFESVLLDAVPACAPEELCSVLLKRFARVYDGIQIPGAADRGSLTSDDAFRYGYVKKRIASIESAIRRHRSDDAQHDGLLRLEARARRIAHLLNGAREAVMYVRYVYDNFVQADRSATCGPYEFAFKSSDSDQEVCELNKLQTLITYLLSTARRFGYAKRDGVIYERIRDRSTGCCTASWKRVCTIQEFVYRSTDRDTDYSQWCNLTANPSNAANAVTFLQHCYDESLPSLRVDRHCIGFVDGIYVTREDAFYAYGDLPERYTKVGTAKYFDAEFPFEQRGPDLAALCPELIATPHTQSIMDYQALDADVCDWMYAFMGRLLYEVHELDNWQVIPFFLGMAQSGKSTLLMSLCAHFFDESVVGVLSNNVERKFGLSGFCDKFVFIAPEVNESLCLDQAEFQSMVAGDMMQVARKNVTSETVRWTVPGILAGNQVPGWKDTAGSIVRRIVVFRFGKTVTDADTMLATKLRGELARCLVKCNKTYLRRVHKCGGAGIWTQLPRYFTLEKQRLQESVDVLYGFLHSSDKLKFDKDACMQWTEFTQLLKRWCADSGYPAPKLGRGNEGAFLTCLRSANCEKTGKEKRVVVQCGEEREVEAVWVLGVTAADNVFTSSA